MADALGARQRVSSPVVFPEMFFACVCESRRPSEEKKKTLSVFDLVRITQDVRLRVCGCVFRHIEIRGAERELVEIQICETCFPKITHFDTNSC